MADRWPMLKKQRHSLKRGKTKGKEESIQYLLYFTFY